MYKLNFKNTDFYNLINKYSLKSFKKNLEVSKKVSLIIRDVVSKGDVALAKYTKLYDNFSIDSSNIKVSKSEILNAKSECKEETLKSLNLAARRIAIYQKKLLPKDFKFKDKNGMLLGCNWTAIESCGLYVPGGKAIYPSSVLMNAIPAKIAGVQRLVMVVPAPNGIINPIILAAAEISGVTEIYKIGGAQSVAAMAYGTNSIKPVDKIVGPGNAYVAEAKRQVFGLVGIDSIAGPSEIMIVADRFNNADWIAMDLLSQAEHDEEAKVIFITDDNDFAITVEQSIKKNLQLIKRKKIASKSIKNNGLIVVVPNMSVVPDIVNFFAPEHLEILLSKYDHLIKKIKNAGAIFVGSYTPEAVGDYIAGPSHVLPTNRSARYASGLSVLDFLKRTSLIKANSKSINLLGNSIINIAQEEGLDAHARSIKLRLK